MLTDTYGKTVQQISFAWNLDRAEGARMYFFTEEAKQTILDFSRGTVEVLWFYFVSIKY